MWLGGSNEDEYHIRGTRRGCETACQGQPRVATYLTKTFGRKWKELRPTNECRIRVGRRCAECCFGADAKQCTPTFSETLWENPENYIQSEHVSVVPC